METTLMGSGIANVRALAGLNVVKAVTVLVLLQGLLAAAEPEDSPVPTTASMSVPMPVSIMDRLPYGREPIDYFSDVLRDPIASLNERLESTEVRLEAVPEHGYLPALLKTLDIPLESQLLVYSKTARNPERVSPQTPRAIYFNDDITVAWIPGTRDLELTAVDPVKGVNFYTLAQPTTEADEVSPAGQQGPRFVRRDRCLACHAGRSSIEVPGLLLRAFQTDKTGKPLQGFSRQTHEMDYSKRWGGWYVQDSPTGFEHRGNLISSSDNERHRHEAGFRSSIRSLSEIFDAGRYLTDSSTIVAHLVFTHQMHGLNLINRVGMEERLGRRSDAEEQLVRYLVFADEPPLPQPLIPFDSPSAQGYIEWFESLSETDSKGRSLRQFDLRQRTFRFRLSYLIEHAAFQQLPASARERIYLRLWSGLTDSWAKSSSGPEAKSEPALFGHLPTEERQAIREIVADTIHDLPDFWHVGEESR